MDSSVHTALYYISDSTITIGTVSRDSFYVVYETVDSIHLDMCIERLRNMSNLSVLRIVSKCPVTIPEDVLKRLTSYTHNN